MSYGRKDKVIQLNQSKTPAHKDTWRIGVIFGPQEAIDSTTTIKSTLHLLEPLAEEVWAITSNFPENASDSQKVHIINFRTRVDTRFPMLVRFPRFVMLQFKVSYHFLKIASKVDVVLLAAGTATLVLPALLAKLFRKRVIFTRHGTSAFQEAVKVDYQKTLFGMGKYIFPPIVFFLIRLNCRLADRIAVFSSTPAEPELKGFESKTSPGVSRFYVDTGFLKVEKSLESRENLVGYIGRFAEIKGVLNFAKAIPLIAKKSEDRFLIGGDGPLREEVEKEIKDAGLGDRVNLTGWIPHEELPGYLNMIKLLVIPSYAEVGPHVVFEAMACGTPVLATPVGVMPDVIKDGETGFIMENNSPGCIASNVIRALNHRNLSEIAENARKVVEKEYTQEAATERYRRILASLK